jgi:hypothetical protein
MSRAPVFRIGSVTSVHLFETLPSICSASTGIPKSTLRLRSVWHVRPEISSFQPKSAVNAIMKEGAQQQPFFRNNLCSTIHEICDASSKFGEASVKVGSAASVLAESSRETSKAVAKIAEAAVDVSKAVTKIKDAAVENSKAATKIRNAASKIVDTASESSTTFKGIGLCLKCILYSALGKFIASTLQPIRRLFCHHSGTRTLLRSGTRTLLCSGDAWFLLF